jgi:putative mRNA 3-end processing factor
MVDTLLILTEAGLYCPAGDFYIDPWRAVSRAVVTHAHADHLTWGSRRYLVSREGERVVRVRLGPDADVETVPYGETVTLNRVRISLHPAGHILGSVQVRVEYHGEVWVVTGDYKIEPDLTCTPFELVPCNTLVTESTFGLPIYRWQPQAEVFEQINHWWRTNQQAGKASVIYCYALGKAQRLIMGVDASIGPIYTHGAVERINREYRMSGIALPETIYTGTAEKPDWSKGLIVAPPSARGTPWLRKFGTISTAFTSGWMRIRGARRQRSVDRGIVLSDHVDWAGLMKVISATGADRVWVTHGYSAVVARWLQEQGVDAQIVQTQYEGERDDSVDNLTEDVE